jgi:hypothetical protein
MYLYPCRADFWAYASIMAINLGVLNTNSGVTSSGIYFPIQVSAVQLEIHLGVLNTNSEITSSGVIFTLQVFTVARNPPRCAQHKQWGLKFRCKPHFYKSPQCLEIHIGVLSTNSGVISSGIQGADDKLGQFLSQDI